jgi:hypothetical protein
VRDTQETAEFEQQQLILVTASGSYASGGLANSITTSSRGRGPQAVNTTMEPLMSSGDMAAAAARESSSSRRINFLEAQLSRLHKENLALKRESVSADPLRTAQSTDAFRKILNESGALFNKTKGRLDRALQALHGETAKNDALRQEALSLREALSACQGERDSLHQRVEALERKNAKISKMLASHQSRIAVSALMTNASASSEAKVRSNGNTAPQQLSSGMNISSLYDVHLLDPSCNVDDEVLTEESGGGSTFSPRTTEMIGADVLPEFMAAVDRVVAAVLVPLTEAEEAFRGISQQLASSAANPRSIGVDGAVGAGRQKSVIGAARIAERRQHLVVLVDCLKDETARVQREVLEGCMRERQLLNTLIARTS